MKVPISYLLLIIIFPTHYSMAQPDEIINKRKEVNQYKAQLDRDTQALRKFQKNISDFESAYLRKDSLTIVRLKDQLQSIMQNKLVQDERRIVSERQKLLSTKRNFDKPQDKVHPSKSDLLKEEDLNTENVKSTKVDIKSQESELHTLTQQIQKQKEIIRNFKALEFNNQDAHSKDYNKPIELLYEFVHLINSDLEATKRKIEKMELELKEDSRGTKSDLQRPQPKPEGKHQKQ